MDALQCKDWVVGCITRHFDGALAAVGKVGGAGGKAPAAIEAAKLSLVRAAWGVRATIYPDYELSAKILKSGVDLAYRNIAQSDAPGSEQWLAVLAVGLEELDEHTRKVVSSWHGQSAVSEELGETVPRRLIAFITRGNGVDTFTPVCAIANEVQGQKLALTPCVFQWAIPQPNGQSAVVGHVDLNQEVVDWMQRAFSLVDSAQTARLHEEHSRGVDYGTMQ